MAELVDWALAARTAKRLSPAPPSVSRVEAEDAVGELYQATSAAAGHVAELTHLREPPISAITRVVDRDAWIDSNAAGMRSVMSPVIEKLAEANPVGRATQLVGGKITGTQVGAILAFLSGKVLGQFDFFERSGGQLMLVAPNIVAVERQLDVPPADFRLWVCLHEVTHRVQFTAVPWTRHYMLDQVQALAEVLDTDATSMKQRLSDALGELAKVARGKSEPVDGGLLALISTPEQREVMDRVTAFMSLVEGHAEYVMNAVSPDVIPSQPQIERKFGDRRRRGGNVLDRVLRKLLGMDAKTRQYVDGAKFVRSVVDRVGVEGFNAIWTSRDTLPTKAEISNPAAWIGRVHA